MKSGWPEARLRRSYQKYLLLNRKFHLEGLVMIINETLRLTQLMISFSVVPHPSHQIQSSKSISRLKGICINKFSSLKTVLRPIALLDIKL